MRAAPDLLSTTPAAARAIERQWAAASEHAADRSAGDERRRPLRARLGAGQGGAPDARAGTPIAEPISALVDGGDITARVTRLLDDASPTHRRSATRWIPLAAASAVAIAYLPLLRLVHGITEVLVNGLP